MAAAQGGGFVPDPSWPSIVELATEAWGQPTDRSPHEIRWGANGSKSVRLSDLTWFDHEANAGGGYVDIWRIARGAGTPLPPRTNGHAGGHTTTGNGSGPEPWHNVAIAYDYRDGGGTLIAQNCRMRPGYRQRFMQRRPSGRVLKNGDPVWKWSTKGLDIPLYHVSELHAASADNLVFITEGEKDADRLIAAGLIATTNIAGAAHWDGVRHNGCFAGRHVVILEDNDDAGRQRTARIAPGLTGVAASLRVLALPGLPEKGDVSDWLDAGGTIAELDRLARETPLWVPPEPDLDPPPEPDLEPPPEWDLDPPPPEQPPGGPRPGEPDELPVILCIAGELPRVVREAQAALLNAGLPIYQRGMLVQPTEQEYTAADGSVTHSASLVPLTAPALRLMMSRSAVFMKWNASVRPARYMPCDPPPALVDVVLHNRGGWPFPVVRGVLTCPTLRPDGSLLLKRGYDPVSRYYLMFPQGLELPEIPEAPTKAHAQLSFARLNALLDSYPWVSRASRSVGQSMLMTQVLRCAMPVSPLHAVSAKAPGTGKSHLVDLASTVAIGRPCPAMGTGKKDEETEKGINTLLIAGVPGFSIDNVSRDLDTPTLNMATERPLITIRLFGVLEHVEIENAVVIYMTGNNLAIIDEQGRRTIRAELDAGREDPERRAFDGDPIHTARADRGRYIADVLTIARAYHLSGERVAPFPLGSYGAWSHFVREPLIWLEQADPVDTMEQAARDDPSNLRLHAIVNGWHAEFGEMPRTIAEAVKDASDGFLAVMREHFPAHGGSSVDNSRMGYWLRKFAGRVVGRKRFVKDDSAPHGSVRWYVAITT
jgi:putative DNA primase/helicase